MGREDSDRDLAQAPNDSMNDSVRRSRAYESNSKRLDMFMKKDTERESTSRAQESTRKLVYRENVNSCINGNMNDLEKSIKKKEEFDLAIKFQI